MVFFINLPLGFVVLLLALWKVPESSARDQGERPDFLGGVLATVGFAGVIYALIQSDIIVGALGATALIALLYWEQRAPSPMIPLDLFRSKNFTGAN
jgi:hypothetical protein